MEGWRDGGMEGWRDGGIDGWVMGYGLQNYGYELWMMGDG